MHWLDLTLPTPEQNLAADEALLAAAAAPGGREVLRIWEAPSPFVVLGHANTLHTEVHADACAQRAIPVLRRCSGGGTVVQGPGCLSYALILRIDGRPELASVSQTNRCILETHRALISRLIGEPVSVSGITDLARAGLKFSGNAQKRGRTHLLFHGTFLYRLDLDLVETLLPLPSRRPLYRQDRPHRTFLANLPVDPHALATALRRAWSADLDFPTADLPWAEMESLVRTRYARPEWTARF